MATLASTKARPRRTSTKALSVMAMRIVQEALRDDISLRDLARLVSGDAAVTLRVVSVANSAAFGIGREVRDVQQACALLGVRGLRNLALGLMLTDMAPASEAGSLLLAGSLRRAVTARLLAQRLGEPTDEHFTTGLLIDVGLLSYATDNPDGAAELARTPAAGRPTIEHATFGDDHSMRGARLAADMGLPRAMVDAVLRHHDPRPPDAALGAVAWAAERVAALWEGGDLTRSRAVALSALAGLGMPAGTAEDVLAEIPALVDEAAGVFARSVGAQPSYAELLTDVNKRLVELNESYETMLRRLELLVTEKEQLAEQLRLANAELAHAAGTDALTGLANRRLFVESLHRDAARADRTRTALSLLMVDVDHFKHVNDKWGHLTGDVVLEGVARALKACVRSSDVAARYGGEELAVILPDTDRAGARVVAERIRAAVERTASQGPGGPVRVTVSVGVATRERDAKESPEALLSAADSALYAAKDAGRNCVRVV